MDEAKQIEDLKRTLDCLEVMREEGSLRDRKAGKINHRVDGLIPYRVGQIVIYRTEPKGTVTIESALTQEQIKEEREKGSYISTIGTMVGVPARYVDEVTGYSFP